MSIPRQARPLEEVLQAIGDLPDGDVTLRSPYHGNKDFDDRAGTFL